MKNLLRSGLTTLILLVALGAIAGTDVAGAIRLSGNGDTLSASPTNSPTKRRSTQVRIVSTNANKTYTLKAGTTSSGSRLADFYIDKDEHDTAFAAGTTHTMTWNLELEVPSTGLYLETDDTSTSGAIYIYARPDGSK